MTPRERRQAEVERAKAAIEAHRPRPTEYLGIGITVCRWCGGKATIRLVAPDAPFDVCEFHAIRALEAGGAIEGDESGKRAAGLIAKAAVLRVKRGG